MSEQSITETEKPFWLTGNFAPVYEELTENDLKVTGNIPPELNGRYFRNGSNPQSGETAHWFLGNGMIHGVELADGKANWYRNRYVQTPLLQDPDADPMNSLDDRSRSLANTHIIGHAGKILALEEGHWPFELTPDLETVGAYTYDGKLKGGMTAHPKICPQTGELLFFYYGMTPPYLTYHRASADGQLIQSEAIEVKGATMVHDFNVTRNHIIFMDLPLVWNFENFSGGLPIQWSEEYGARLGVMPRDGSNKDVVWYDIDPCYVYHPMNAYEDGDNIVIDVCRLAHSMKPGAADVPPVLHRWVIDQATGKVSEQQLDDRAVDFPRVPDSVVGLPYRYGYTAEFGAGGPTASSFVKYDMKTGTSVAHELEAGRAGGEPVFVPAAGATSEDDGYLISFVYDQAENVSELVIVDASSMANEPVARVHLPTRVPAGFHGSWIADQ
ncbi:MAG: carotenoid oxygenase family protein [bacterium]|nr:dioxygenase [Gammaproteobacteria bacterium]HIL97759.1 dioxygenase [Pseudomonadales bacterium]